jgi:hypothetical protein
MTASWTDVTDDPIRLFSNALTPAARHHFDLNYQTIRLIRAAAQHRPPAELARICSTGIGWHTPANPAGLILFRLRREAHIDDDTEADTQ